MDKTSPKTAMSAADLFVMLDREYRRRRTRECDTCFVQLPFRVDQVELGRANWEVVTPPGCPASCESVLQDLVQEFQERYDLVTR